MIKIVKISLIYQKMRHTFAIVYIQINNHEFFFDLACFRPCKY